MFPWLMYRGGAEKKIRQYLIDNNYIDCVIQLPDNLFYGTSIAICIMVLKKSKSENRTLFIDASKEFVKVTNNNKLTQKNIDKILNAFIDRKDIEHFAKLVQNSEIAKQDYNLSVSTYVEQEDTREKIDIVALNSEIEKIVARERALREEIEKIIAEIDEAATTEKFSVVQQEGARQVQRKDKEKILKEVAVAELEAEYAEYNKTQKIISDFDREVKRPVEGGEKNE